jgi:hypothetical protein
VLTELALVAFTLTVVAGLTMLVRLVRSGRRLPRLIWLHLVTVLLPFCGWAAYAATDDRPRWLAAVVLLVLMTIGMPSGDQLMLRAWRARATRDGRLVHTGLRAYLAAARDIIAFGRPTASLHAILGAVGFFSVLLVTLGVAD